MDGQPAARSLLDVAAQLQKASRACNTRRCRSPPPDAQLSIARTSPRARYHTGVTAWHSARQSPSIRCKYITTWSS
jgi:hypothetical protein